MFVPGIGPAKKHQFKPFGEMSATGRKGSEMDDSCKNVEGSDVVATSVRESNSVDKDREKGNPGECPDSHGTYLHSLPIL